MFISLTPILIGSGVLVALFVAFLNAWYKEYHCGTSQSMISCETIDDKKVWNYHLILHYQNFFKLNKKKKEYLVLIKGSYDYTKFTDLQTGETHDVGTEYRFLRECLQNAIEKKIALQKVTAFLNRKPEEKPAQIQQTQAVVEM